MLALHYVSSRTHLSVVFCQPSPVGAAFMRPRAIHCTVQTVTKTHHCVGAAFMRPNALQSLFYLLAFETCVCYIFEKTEPG